MDTLTPMMFMMLMRMMQRMQSTQQQPLNVNVDLSAIRDLIGAGKLARAEGDQNPEPLPVAVTNMPIPRPG